eukprot:6196836-Pleurochrysis_carterae.AAC.1
MCGVDSVKLHIYAQHAATAADRTGLIIVLGRLAVPHTGYGVKGDSVRRWCGRQDVDRDALHRGTLFKSPAWRPHSAHARTHASTHARMHACTHARSHTRT